jgi:hypothetical protein
MKEQNIKKTHKEQNYSLGVFPNVYLRQFWTGKSVSQWVLSNPVPVTSSKTSNGCCIPNLTAAENGSMHIV